ncbi:progranulin isoform X1 [Pogona vitticeps]
MWAELIVCVVLSGRAFSLQCPDGSHCGESSACCQLPGGKYACCDPPQFVGTSLRMLSPESVNEISGVVCPDGSTCPLEYSCLLTVDAAFACCPWKEAISCADGHHCCPLGSHCSADGRSCLQSKVSTPAIVSAVQCPDHESECPNDSTCCMMPDGTWGCCPMPEAFCCSDKIHCCPHDTTCDLEHERCSSASGEQPLGKKFPAKKRAQALSLAQKNICPGNHSTCPDLATCCLFPTGQYGCCPLQNAVCCDDHLHCCPQGTTCDLSHSKCTMTSRWSWPITRLSVDLQTARDVVCDPEHACPDGNTCCRTVSGKWGCCPLEEAVCCADHIHCCPKGYQCNVEMGTCEKEENRSVPWLLKTDARSTASSSGMAVPCDHQTTCPDGQTCCRLVSGAWGCCPVPQAVCCPDHVHCCPSGYRCDPSQGSCLKSRNSVPWLEKKPAIVAVASSSRDTKCDDKTSCADGQTCCQLVTGVWACCPFPQAVCCKDHVHCCPNGYSCNVQRSACVKSSASSQLISLAPVRARQVEDVKCDDKTSCKDGQTCCQLASGEWGCCPFPQAVCCADRVHCCPNGYTCDPSSGTCQESSHSLPWAPKHPARMTQIRGIRCNDTVSCEEGQTCCKGVSGAWSCCQLPNAVCCDDHQHCCPSGYTCNVAAQTCEKQQEAGDLASGGLLMASRLSTSSRDVSCGDQHYCRDGQTCCEASSGGWACCPYDKGSCCTDRRHCCPAGFRCSRSGFECYKKWPPRWDVGAFSPRSAPSRPLL